MASAISKQEIRRNPLAEWIGLVVRFVGGHRNLVMAVLVGFAIVAAGGSAYMWYASRQEREASVALAEAQASLRGDKPGATVNLDAAMPRFRAVSERYRGTESGEEASIRLGNLQFENGRLDEARTTFDEYLKVYPRGRFVLMAGLGKAYAQEAKGDLQGAAQTLSDLVAKPDDGPLAGEAYSTLGRIYESLKKPDDAMRVYNQIVERFPQTSWAQNALDRMSTLKTK
ncbi:MAG TPA: tetratricopeptide repeat protein, partial [Candidatus Methylomirabilis sp.]|nr:tetratricopeptide repeat protein [Candidatus Methylomirabilis sp.]HSC72371.1 tetratricopeptide repeat protein [Candidatus Methylomirabilis sp.]